MSSYHTPVMVGESIHYLNVKPGKWYLDCTLGGGGHSERILELGGKVLGIDLDSQSISFVAKKHGLKKQNIYGRRVFVTDYLTLVQDNFTNIKAIVKDLEIIPSGILFDLGVSSYQLEKAERGFSFNLDALLDMRMDKNAQVPTAADLVNGLHEKELAELFWKLGEENFSKKIAKAIVEYRQKRKIETTNELANIILSVRARTFSDRTHPATRVFQALRIAVNDELNSLKEALPKALEVLEKGGRLVVISFHSLEDRIVKNYFKDWEEKGLVKILTKKPVEPTEEEISQNPRARSGKLRAIEKLILN